MAWSPPLCVVDEWEEPDPAPQGSILWSLAKGTPVESRARRLGVVGDMVFMGDPGSGFASAQGDDARLPNRKKAKGGHHHLNHTDTHQLVLVANCGSVYFLEVTLFFLLVFLVLSISTRCRSLPQSRLLRHECPLGDVAGRYCHGPVG